MGVRCRIAVGHLIMSLSTYLTSPPTRRRRISRAIWRRNLPRRFPGRQLSLGLLSWMVAIASVGYVSNHHSLTSPAVFSAAAQAAGDNQHVPRQLMGGPVGGLLPPGTLAPYGTFSNHYAPGQCTWYVASRRQVPPNWGNARSWLRGAQAAGWNTGAIPAVGAIAWSPVGYYGHVAVVETVLGDRVLIAEMNFQGPYRIDQRWSSASIFTYIY
jgi:hypothetical protein